MKIKNFFQNVLLIATIWGCEAKQKQNKGSIDFINPSQKVVMNCKKDTHCTNFDDYLKDMALCNVTDSTCTNYCMVKVPCTNDFDCNYSIGDRKKCGVSCHKNNVNDTIGLCLIVNKQGQFCNNNHIICEDELICDFYTDTCITKAEAQNQSGEPLFSLFLFLLIMASLLNRQRADEEFLNTMGPNELLMVTLPNRRHQPEDDILPVYQPIEENNEDELIEQNLAVPGSDEEQQSAEQSQTEDSAEVIFDDDDLPLLPPTYDEAVNGYMEVDTNDNIINNTQEPQNNNSS